MSYFDDTDDSEALGLWQERLEAYLGGQEGVEGLRSRVQPNPPWPDSDNPMLGYLLARAMEIHEADGLEMAFDLGRRPRMVRVSRRHPSRTHPPPRGLRGANGHRVGLQFGDAAESVRDRHLRDIPQGSMSAGSGMMRLRSPSRLRWCKARRCSTN